jgi:hypothetical protein
MHSPHQPIHARDFAPMRQQRPLAELPADANGLVWFACSRCDRTGAIALATLRERYPPQTGLVAILNALAPADCVGAAAGPTGASPCGYYYRDLARGPPCG